MLVTAGVVTIVYLLLGLRVLWVGHPNEDAYILFTYVENFVASGGTAIEYSRGVEPAQGFVDLAWFFLLGVVGSLGADPAVTAISLSALCAGGLAAVLVRVAPDGLEWRVLVGCVCLTFHGSVASLGGFGTLLFCLGTAASYAALRFDWPRVRLLLLALLPAVRLEGLVCAAVLGAIHYARDRSFRNATVAVACFGVPLVVATQFRAIQFGDPIPLPVYVKSDGLSVLPGLISNLRWAYRETGPLPFLVVALLVGLVRRLPRSAWQPLLVAALPGLAVLAPLFFAEQIQNVRWRYQAPATIACVLVCFELLKSISSKRVAFVLGLLACAATVGLGGKHVYRLLDGRPKLHAHRFVPRLAELLPAKTEVATTEAGVVGFWLRCPVTDIIGLNDSYYAHYAVTVKDLAKYDVLVFNTYDVTDAASWPFDESGIAELQPEHMAVAQRLGTPSRLEAAASECVRFLGARRDRALFAVREGRNVLVWAFPRDMTERREIEQLLREAADATRHRGYLRTPR